MTGIRKDSVAQHRKREKDGGEGNTLSAQVGERLQLSAWISLQPQTAAFSPPKGSLLTALRVGKVHTALESSLGPEKLCLPF